MIDGRMALALAWAVVPIVACTKPAKVEVLSVYKSAACGCCDAWVKHVRANGLQVKVFETERVADKARELGVPAKFRTCHTAEIGGYFIEGHVPVDDIHRLLRERPDALGLAVPDMPIGPPKGKQGEPRATFTTVIVNKAGRASIFHRHNVQATR